MDQAPKLETEKTIENIHDFLNLSSEEKERLKRKIEKSDGLVRIFVHPLFENWRSDQDEDANYNPAYRKDILEVEKTLSRIITIEKEKTPPLIIMEEKEFVPELKKWIKDNNPKINSQKEIYLVNTLPNNPTPNIEELKNLPMEELMQMVDDPNRDPFWKVLKDKLRETGVKKILLGGMQFETSKHKKDWTNQGPWVARCVGIAMSHLSKDKGGEFEVELSALTAPFSERRYFKDLMRKPKE